MGVHENQDRDPEEHLLYLTRAAEQDQTIESKGEWWHQQPRFLLGPVSS